MFVFGCIRTDWPCMTKERRYCLLSALCLPSLEGCLANFTSHPASIVWLALLLVACSRVGLCPLAMTWRAFRGSTHDIILCLCSLTDSPAPGEVIQATMSLKGDLPGNKVDPLPHVDLSTYSFNFTTENCCARAQPLDITTSGKRSLPPCFLFNFRTIELCSYPC